jgi:nitroreductase
MDVISAIEQRRSVKHFDPGHRMSSDEVERLLANAILSPTSFNIQNWRFVLVEDAALRRDLRGVSWDQAQVTDASLLLILCADLNAWARQPERYWRNAAPQVRKVLIPAITATYEGNPQAQRDEAMRSCGLAAQTIMLTAKAMGYDSCPMVGFDPIAVGKLINLPEDHVIVMMIAVGKAVDAPRERGGQLPLTEVIINDRF